MIELKPSKEMHEYYPSYTIDEIASDVLKVITGYHVCHTGEAYLKELKLITRNRRVTKLGKKLLILHFDKHSLNDQISLIKPL